MYLKRFQIWNVLGPHADYDCTTIEILQFNVQCNKISASKHTLMKIYLCMIIIMKSYGDFIAGMTKYLLSPTKVTFK